MNEDPEPGMQRGALDCGLEYRGNGVSPGPGIMMHSSGEGSPPGPAHPTLLQLAGGIHSLSLCSVAGFYGFHSPPSLTTLPGAILS